MDSTLQSAIVTSAALAIIEFGKLAWKRWGIDSQKPDLADEDYEDMIGEIMSDIQNRFQAHRTAYFAGQNGEKTLDGHSLKKLSMMVEKNAEGVDEIKKEMQNVPRFKFKRNIDLLKNSETGSIVTYESTINDQLSELNRSYGCETLITVRVNNIKNRTLWTGLLTVCFEEVERAVYDTELAWLAFQVSRIEVIISKI